MLIYILNRIAQAVVVIWLAFTVVFVAVALLPSDPISIFLASDGGTLPLETVEQMRSYYGYDQPLHVQYLKQLALLAAGDFGYSITTGQPVTARIAEVGGYTLRLAALALFAAILISFAVVLLATLHRSADVRAATRAIPGLFSSLPAFWLGLVALQIFSVQFNLIGLSPDGTFLSLLIPALTLAIPLSAPLSQVLIKSISSVQESPFVNVVRAKGASESWIFFRHVLKNAGPAALTILGLTIGHLFTGAVVVETVFSRAGIGRVLLTAVSAQDLSLLAGVVLLTAVVYAGVNLLVDLTYPLLDPRVLRRGIANSGIGHV
ncbi:ABC transporter permease [Pseudochelatococcus sp. B33]